MNYTQLVADVTTAGSIKYHQNWSRLDSDGILDEAEQWIYSKLRVRQMMATDDVAISLAASTAPFPTGYLDPIHLSIPGFISTIKMLDPERFRSQLGWDESAALPEAMPTRWADIDGLIQFNSKADQAYTAKFVFYKTPLALSADNLTNFLTDRFPSLLRRVCLMFASEERKEYESMDRHELKALAMIEEIKKESDLSYRGLEADFGWEANS